MRDNVGNREQEAQIKQSIEHIAERAASRAVRETLMMFGIDTADPIKAQEQFATLRQLANARTVENLEFVERIRNASDRISDTSWRTVIRVVVTAALGMFAVMTHEYWLSHVKSLFFK